MIFNNLSISPPNLKLGHERSGPFSRQSIVIWSLEQELQFLGSCVWVFRGLSSTSCCTLDDIVIWICCPWHGSSYERSSRKRKNAWNNWLSAQNELLECASSTLNIHRFWWTNDMIDTLETGFNMLWDSEVVEVYKRSITCKIANTYGFGLALCSIFWSCKL